MPPDPQATAPLAAAAPPSSSRAQQQQQQTSRSSGPAAAASPERKKPTPKPKGKAKVATPASTHNGGAPPALDAGHLHAVAEEMHTQARDYREHLRRVLADARALYRSLAGKSLTNLHPAFRNNDYTSIANFDGIARTIASRYPGVLVNAHGQEFADIDSVKAAEKLFALLAAGVPQVKRADSLKEAAHLLTYFPAADGATPEVGAAVAGEGSQGASGATTQSNNKGGRP